MALLVYSVLVAMVQAAAQVRAEQPLVQPVAAVPKALAVLEIAALAMVVSLAFWAARATSAAMALPRL